MTCPVHGDQCPELEAILIRRDPQAPQTPAPPPVPSRLLYAEDVRPGAVLELTSPRTGLQAMLSGPGEQTWGTVLDVRDSAGVYSFIVVDDDGQQQPFVAQGIQLVRVRIDS